MRKIFLPALILALFLAAGIGYLASTRQSIPKENPSTPGTVSEESNESVLLVLDFGGGQVSSYTLPFQNGVTAFSVLKVISERKDIALETQQYDFGIFVKSIDGKESSAEMAWIYFVNREPGSVASDQHTLKAGDVVEWKYVKPEK